MSNTVYSFKVEANTVIPVARLSWNAPARTDVSTYVPDPPLSYNLYYKEGLSLSVIMSADSIDRTGANEAKAKGFSVLASNISNDITSFETTNLKPGVYTFAVSCNVEADDTTGKPYEGPLVFKSLIISDVNATSQSNVFAPLALSMTDDGTLFYLSNPAGANASIHKLSPYGVNTFVLDLGENIFPDGFEVDENGYLNNASLNYPQIMETDGVNVYMYIDSGFGTYGGKIIRVTPEGSVTSWTTSNAKTIRVRGNQIFAINSSSIVFKADIKTNGILNITLNFSLYSGAGGNIFGERFETWNLAKNNESFVEDDFEIINIPEPNFGVTTIRNSVYNKYNNNMYGIGLYSQSSPFDALYFLPIQAKYSTQYYPENFKEKYFKFPADKTNWFYMSGVTSDVQGKIYISEYETDSIWCIDTNGNVFLYGGSAQVYEDTDYEIYIPDLDDYVGWIGDVQIIVPPGFDGEVELRTPENETIAIIPLPEGLPPGGVLTFRKIGNRFYIIYNGRIIITYLLNPIQMSYFNSTGYTGFYKKSTNEQVGWEEVGGGAYLGVPPVDGGIYSIINSFSEPMESNIELYAMGLNYYGMTLMIFEDDSVIFTRDPITEDIQRAKKIIYGGRNYGLDAPVLNSDEAWLLYQNNLGEYLLAVD
jgi:hypothetical protein